MREHHAHARNTPTRSGKHTNTRGTQHRIPKTALLEKGSVTAAANLKMHRQRILCVQTSFGWGRLPGTHHAGRRCVHVCVRYTIVCVRYTIVLSPPRPRSLSLPPSLRLCLFSVARESGHSFVIATGRAHATSPGQHTHAHLISQGTNDPHKHPANTLPHLLWIHAKHLHMPVRALPSKPIPGTVRVLKRRKARLAPCAHPPSVRPL